jgi:hypothetical protein
VVSIPFCTTSFAGTRAGDSTGLSSKGRSLIGVEALEEEPELDPRWWLWHRLSVLELLPDSSDEMFDERRLLCLVPFLVRVPLRDSVSGGDDPSTTVSPT